MERVKRFSITTPIFYVNGPPHIGHAYTVVAADVLARFYRQQGAEVFFLTGTDEHGAKIAEAAGAQGKNPQEFADEIAATFKNAWEALDVHYDDFIRTTEPRHEAGVKQALQDLHDRGFLYEKSYRGLYCTGCEKFVTEKDLDEKGKCPLHNRKPDLLEEKNWFFKLSAFLGEVRARIERGDLNISPPERKNEVLGLFGQGIEDFSISRPKERVPWAILLPFDDSQTCYVWVDALLNYITALGYGEDTQAPWPKAHAQGKYWPVDLQLIGQDILKFHAIYWPAILLALDLPLPREIFVHGFFTVNGQKISKSLGNVIDPLALVQRYGSDATRYLLLSQFPFGASGDVQAARFDEQYNAVLANTIGNLVSRTITLLQKFSGGKIPDAQPDPTTAHVILNEVKDLSSVVADLDAIVAGPVRLAQELNQYADRTAPWKETDAAKRATALRTLADGIVRLALLAEPLLPRTSAAIQHAFNVPGRSPSEALPAGRSLGEGWAKEGTPDRLSRVAQTRPAKPSGRSGKGRSGIRPTNPPVLFPRQV
ncbi:MAG: methionyl-tRNA synthetase [Parcubacteria group bacterium Gr01-1014_38]|nr:MAG: methionyl-tRNA synthetase [Parcubacteria group bacterium Gr01-1014_38]